MQKGSIVIIPFPFTDLSGSKLRPALILIETALDVTVAFITTQLQWKEKTDILLTTSISTGIKKESLIRLSKMATLDKSLVKGKMGEISHQQIMELNRKLKILFEIV